MMQPTDFLVIGCVDSNCHAISTATTLECTATTCALIVYYFIVIYLFIFTISVKNNTPSTHTYTVALLFSLQSSQPSCFREGG